MAGLQGRTLGGYQLTEQIASAGIAEVYRGRPLAANGRDVVIKVIYPEFARYPSFLPNFQHIVQTAARLANHPHILPVVASGEENGYLYLATPWVADGTLRDLIARGGRLGVSDAGPFFQQLCSALAYAHSLSLTHGNLKPSNVFLYEGRHVMLGDFGMLWDIRQLDMNHSGSGTDVVEYLAPESFSGQFTQQSDIYSLGAILFATLTGRPPFSAAKPADLRDAHMQYPPPHLGQVDPSLSPGVQALDPIIQQAMAKRPEDRFPSAMALAQAIDIVLKQQPPTPAMPAMRALPPGLPNQPMAQPGPQPGLPQPGAPSSWVAPGPIAPAGATIRPPDPPFPPFNGGQQPAPPLAQGWPAQAEPPLAQGWPSVNGVQGVQYTERVPAPPVVRPLVSRPQLNAPNGAMAGPGAPSIAEPDPWGGQYPPANDDDPEWQQVQWPQQNGDPDGPPRRLAARDDDWRLERNSPSQAARNGQSNTNYPSEYSEYTDQRVALPDNSYGMSRDDWASRSQSGPHSEALRYRGGFSATELGLPRLTNPALQGELPPEWEDLLAGEMLRSRADLQSRSPRRPPPPRGNPQESYGYSSVGQPYPPDRAGSRSVDQHGQDFDDGYSAWQPVAGKPGPQRAQPMPTLASAQYPAYTDSRMPASPHAPTKRHEDSGERKSRWPAAVLLVALLLALIASTSIVLAKPTVCPGTFCVQANHFLHRHLTFLGPAGNANVLQVTPGTLTIQATAGSSTNLSVQVSNSGTDSAVWHASASVGWLTITPSNGTIAPGATATLSVVASPLDVKPGNYSAQVKVETPDTSVNIPVAAAIAVGPKIQLPAAALSITQCGAPQPFKIGNTGDGALNFSAKPSNATAVQLSNTSGAVNPGSDLTLSVTINCSAFFADYTIGITSNGGNGTITIHYT